MKKLLLFIYVWLFVLGGTYVLRASNEINMMNAPDETEEKNGTLSDAVGKQTLNLTYTDIVHDGPYTLYVRKDGTISYAAYDEDGEPHQYYTYYGRVHVSDDYTKLVKQVFYVDDVGRIKYVEERRKTTGKPFRYYEYYVDTVFGDNYERHIKTMFEVRPNGDIIRGEQRANVTGIVSAYYQFADNTKYTYPMKENARYVANVDNKNNIIDVREYEGSYWTKAYEFEPETKINHDKQYSEGARYEYHMQKNSISGLLGRGIRYTGDHKADQYYQYQTGATYEERWTKQKFIAFMNEDDTINHVRDYDKEGYWIKEYEFPADVKINHKQAYWIGRDYTFLMKPKTTDGTIARGVKVTSDGRLEFHDQYHGGTKYADTHNKLAFRAFVDKNGVIDHVREYDRNGYWIKAFRFVNGTKIDHNKGYWEGRLFTYHMKPNTTNGLLTYTLEWKRPGDTRVAVKYIYFDNTLYGKQKNHKQIIYY